MLVVRDELQVEQDAMLVDILLSFQNLYHIHGCVPGQQQQKNKTLCRWH
uniref:Uncharacterized protein n=1 Tax=Anguilla anguilla TaxID=7936 RepID=A0A0E9R5J2_ANGAN